MNNTKTTKRALLSSVVAMLVCVAMLIGTTFAWFTDKVTSGRNLIKAGNLDVELEYLNADREWVSVEGKSDLFRQDTLWEPGHTEVVYLKLTNKGRLALDYKMLVYAAAETTGINVNNNPFKLSDHLVFSMIRQGNTPETYTRETVKAAAEGNNFTLGTYAAGMTEVVADTVEYLALVVYMPETVGNEANYKTGTAIPTIDLAIRLEATQATFEKDSFNNKYDYESDGTPDNPEFGQIVDTVVTVSGGLITTVGDDHTETVKQQQTVDAGGVKVTYDAGVKTTDTASADKSSGSDDSADAKQGLVYTGTQTSYTNITVSGTEMLSVYDLTLPVASDNTVLVKIVKNIGEDQIINNVFHNGTALTEGTPSPGATVTGDNGYYKYYSGTGNLYIWVLHASELAVKSTSRFAGGKGTEASPYQIATAEQFARILSGDSSAPRYYKLVNNIDTSAIFATKYYAVSSQISNIVLDGNGKTISGVDTGYLFYLIMNSKIKNLTVDLSGEESAISCYSYYTMLYDHVNVTGEVNVTGNCGTYTIYSFYSDLTFDHCVADVDISGTSYNAVFVGYVNSPSNFTTKLNFNYCENKGSLVCNYASMFIGNPNSYIIVCNAVGCKNSGTIQATNTDKVLNYYYSVPSNCYTTFTINGTVYNDIADGRSSAPSCYDDTVVTTTGKANQGPLNTGMTLTQNADKTFTVTDATIEGKTVDHYTVYVGVYASLKAGGSSRNYVTETISASETNKTTTLKNLKFVDTKWVEDNSQAVRGELAGNVIYTLGGESYYMLVAPDTDTLNGKAKAPQMIYVVAFDANNKTLASATLFGDIA